MHHHTLIRWAAAALLVAASSSPRAQEAIAINEGLSGAWFNPDTPGQGFLFDVVGGSDFIFVAWFTYDVDAAGSKIGAPEHRWLTAQGNYAGAEASLTLSVSENGVFDNPAGVNTRAVGTLDLRVESCSEATLSYDLPDDGLTGEIDLLRLTPDVFCRILVQSSQQAITH